MPGILGYNSSPGLLGNLGQTLMDYGTRQGPFAAPMGQMGSLNSGGDQREIQEYEEAVRRGFRGTFDEFKQQKRARQAMAMSGGANGFNVLAQALGGGSY